MSTDQIVFLCTITSSLVIFWTLLPSSKQTRKKKFEQDLLEIQGVEENINILANKLADLSAEYYRRYQLEADNEDLMLSNSLHEMVNDLKRLESKVKPDSVVENTLSKRVKNEPGYWASLFGRKGRESDGSRQTELAAPNAFKEEEVAL